MLTKLLYQKHLKEEEKFKLRGINMFFRKKGWLRKEYDEKLLQQLNELKGHWKNQSTLVEKSFDTTEEAISDAKLAEAKYFFLFKEAKKRNVTVRY